MAFIYYYESYVTNVPLEFLILNAEFLKSPVKIIHLKS